MDPASTSLRVIRSIVGKADDAPRVIRAYHGTPHSFDRFDASKIGTGEGAQSYGHGLYFAGNESVADSYRRKLSDDGDDPVRWARDYWAAQAESGDFRDPADAHDYILSLVRAQLNAEPGSAYAVTNGPERLASLRESEKWLLSQSPLSVPPPIRQGHMYEVEIDYPEEALLDYDRKLTDQPGPVLDYARSLGYRGDFWTGEDLYGDLGRFTPEDIRPGWTSVLNTVNDRITRPRVASARLMEAGIPGIRYLDQGSRSAGQGTHNYVMFPGTEDRIKILRQYGLLPPLLAPALMEDE